MTVSSSGAELAVNKKQPAEMRFMKSHAPQNMTLTSLGSTLFGERLEPTGNKQTPVNFSLLTFTACLKSKVGPKHAAPKFKMLSRGSYIPNSNFEIFDLNSARWGMHTTLRAD